MRILLILLGIMVGFAPAAARADGKIGQWFGWFPSHTEWTEYKKFNPHLENGMHPHPEQFARDTWQPSDWAAQRKSGVELVSGFYRAGIIRGQDIIDDVPVITVGPNFYHLGGQDKRRVIASINDVYGITAQNPNGAIRLRDWHTLLDIGAYTKQGLMLQ